MLIEWTQACKKVNDLEDFGRVQISTKCASQNLFCIIPHDDQCGCEGEKNWHVVTCRGCKGCKKLGYYVTAPKIPVAFTRRSCGGKICRICVVASEAQGHEA